MFRSRNEDEKAARQQKRLNDGLGESVYNRHHLEVVHEWLKKGADPSHAVDEHKCPVLYRAIENNAVDYIQLLLRYNANPNISRHNIPCLHRALHVCSTETVLLLIEKGADIFTLDPNKNSTAHVAAQNAKLEILQILLEKGVNPKALNDKGETPLDLARKNDHIGIVRFLSDIQGNNNADIAREEWKLITPDSVAHIAHTDALGYQLTSIFNFSTGLYTQIARNTATNAESQTLLPFGQFTTPHVLQEAHSQLTQLGGNTGSETQYRRFINKPSPRLGQK